jgi:anhydro-N-acetylmuramic acid kinase
MNARLLIHLGAVSSLLFLPASAKVSAVVGFEPGPGNQLLDALVYHGTRGKDSSDPGGKKAVQGRCLEPLLARWLEHPHLTRTPPKTVHPEAFGRSFLLAAFDAARQLNAGLPDLLCTATHLAARALGDAAKHWLPVVPGVRQVLVTGGGVRNGFLWQLMAQQFPEGIARADETGTPPLARNAAAAAVLAALTCDGIAGNVSMLTGATGGRLLGHFAPGDGRNWTHVAAWVADQTGEYPRATRAA